MNGKVYELGLKAVTLLKENNMTVATAESCTGGLVSSYITAVPGTSSVFELGITSYSCRIKNKILGVDENTLEVLGAVSPETAEQMAVNVKNLADSSIGVSVTGVAGPDGSEGHAPGLVYIAAAYDGGVQVEKLNIEPLSRDYVRETAVYEIFKLIIKIIGESKK